MRFLLKCAGGLPFVLVVSMVAPTQGTAQIPNPGFETWNAGFPDGWVTSNVPGVVTTVTASGTRRSGSFSARGEVLTAFNSVWPAYLSTVFPQTQLPERLQCYYQFAPQGGDKLFIAVVFFDGFSPFAGADTQIVDPAGSFTLLDLPVEQYVPGTADSCYIYISVIGPGLEGGEPTVGSTFHFDDFSFSGSITSASYEQNVPAVFALDQNYPNPFNPSTTIEYSLPEGGQVRLDVFNAIGERVATLVDNRQDAGRYRATFDATPLPSGVYLYRLNAGGNVSVKRMILMK